MFEIGIRQTIIGQGAADMAVITQHGIKSLNSIVYLLLQKKDNKQVYINRYACLESKLSG